MVVHYKFWSPKNANSPCFFANGYQPALPTGNGRQAMPLKRHYSGLRLDDFVSVRAYSTLLHLEARHVTQSRVFSSVFWEAPHISGPLESRVHKVPEVEWRTSLRPCTRRNL